MPASEQLGMSVSEELEKPTDSHPKETLTDQYESPPPTRKRRRQSRDHTITTDQFELPFTTASRKRRRRSSEEEGTLEYDSSEENGTSTATLSDIYAQIEIDNIRLGIRNSSIVYTEGKTYIKTFEDLLKDHNLTTDQVYKVEEGSLRVKSIEDSTFLYSSKTSERVPQRDHDRERLAVLMCASAAGHKCKPLVVYKSIYRQAFDQTSLRVPVIYKDNENGCLTQSLRQEWFFNDFVAEVKENYHKKGLPEDSKTILLIDRGSESWTFPPSVNLVAGTIFAVDSPPPLTPNSQPKARNVVVKALSWNYREEFRNMRHGYWLEVKDIEDYEVPSDEEEDPDEYESPCCYRNCFYAMDDSVCAIASAWHTVRPLTILKAWKYFWPEVLGDRQENVALCEEDQNIVLLPVVNRTSPGSSSIVPLTEIREIRSDFQKLNIPTVSFEEAGGGRSQLQSFAEFMKSHNFTAEQIYNVKEHSFQWMPLPTRMYVCDWETKPPAWKVNKERITVFLCTNATGHKCKLLVLCKNAHKQEAKNINHEQVLFKTNKTGYMSEDVCEEWFYQHFVAEVKENYRRKGLPVDSKTVLLLDHCKGMRAHPPSDYLVDGNIFAADLPHSIEARSQPMALAEGVIRELRSRYGKLFDKRRFEWTKNEMGPKQCPDRFHDVYRISHAVSNIVSAWDDVEQLTLLKAWKKFWPDALVEEKRPEEELSGPTNCIPMISAFPTFPIAWPSGTGTSLDVRMEASKKLGDSVDQASTSEPLNDLEIIDHVPKPEEDIVKVDEPIPDLSSEIPVSPLTNERPPKAENVPQKEDENEPVLEIKCDSQIISATNQRLSKEKNVKVEQIVPEITCNSQKFPVKEKHTEELENGPEISVSSEIVPKTNEILIKEEKDYEKVEECIPIPEINSEIIPVTNHRLIKDEGDAEENLPEIKSSSEINDIEKVEEEIPEITVNSETTFPLNPRSVKDEKESITVAKVNFNNNTGTNNT